MAWGLLCGALPALCGGIAFRRIWMRLLKQKDLIQALDFDDILNSDFINRLSLGTFIVTSLISIFFACALSLDCVTFYDAYLKVAGEHLIQRDIYFYDDIQEVYHIDARHNDYGDRIERESYILYFDDGNYLDLDGYTSIEISENKILPLLDKKIKYVDNDKDLEFMNE